MKQALLSINQEEHVSRGFPITQNPRGGREEKKKEEINPSLRSTKFIVTDIGKNGSMYRKRKNPRSSDYFRR